MAELDADITSERSDTTTDATSEPSDADAIREEPETEAEAAPKPRLPVRTRYTCPPILPKSKSGYELLGLSSRTNKIKNKGSRYYHDEHLMKDDRVRKYHRAEQAFHRKDYTEAARRCHEIVEENVNESCLEGIMAKANTLLARPELTESPVDRGYYAQEAIHWWNKIILHHEEGHLSDAPKWPWNKVYSKYPTHLAKEMLAQAQELLDDASFDENLEWSTESSDEDTDSDESVDSRGDPPVRMDSAMDMSKEL